MLTSGQRHEATQVAALLEQCGVRRPSGQTRFRPARVAADKGYTGRTIRRYLKRRGIGTVIPRLCTEPRRGARFDKALYRERNRIERMINRLKQNRAIATRYDKLAARYAAMLTIACVFLWI
jgi:transposase